MCCGGGWRTVWRLLFAAGADEFELVRDERAGGKFLEFEAEPEADGGGDEEGAENGEGDSLVDLDGTGCVVLGHGAFPSGLLDFAEPEGGGDEAGVVFGAFGFAVDDLIAGAPVGAGAGGEPVDVGGVGAFPTGGVLAWKRRRGGRESAGALPNGRGTSGGCAFVAVFVEVEEGAGDVLDDGDFGEPGVVGGGGEFDAAPPRIIGEFVAVVGVGEEGDGVGAEGGEGISVPAVGFECIDCVPMERVNKRFDGGENSGFEAFACWIANGGDRSVFLEVAFHGFPGDVSVFFPLVH